MKIKSISRFFILAISFAETLIYFSNDMYLPGMVQIGDSFGVNQAQMALSVMLWFIGAGVSQLVVGGVAASFNKRKIMLFGITVFTVFALLSGLTMHFNTFLLARVIQGSATSFVIVTGYGIVHKIFSGRRAIEVISLMQSISIIAPAFGPILGAGILLYLNWRWMFFFLFFGGVIATFLIYRTCPNIKEKEIEDLTIKKITIDYIKTLKNKDFARFALSLCFRVGAFLFWIIESPFLIVSLKNHSSLFLGLVHCLVCIGFPIGTIAVQRLLKTNRTIHSIVRIGTFVSLFGCMVLLVSKLVNFNIALISLGMFFIVVGCNISNSSLNRCAIDSHLKNKGSPTIASTILSFLISIAGALSGLVASIVESQTQANQEITLSFDLFVIITSVFIVVGSIIYSIGKPATIQEKEM